MTMTLSEAKAKVQEMLDLASGNADTVARSITKAQRNARQYDTYLDEHDDEYAMLRLALSDLTLNATYRAGA